MTYVNLYEEGMPAYTGTQRSRWTPALSSVIKRWERKATTADGEWQIGYSNLFGLPHYILRRRGTDRMWEFVKKSANIYDLLEAVESFYETNHETSGADVRL